MATLLPDFSVRFSQRRWTCVLDPFLALSPNGLILATQLSQVLELWIFRELWQILDNTEYYLHQPETQLAAPPPGKTEPPLLDGKALQTWEQFRTGSDVNRLNMFWIGDSLAQSLLPEGMEPDIIHHYEALASALDGLNPDQRSLHAPIAAACRDAAALAACLNSALILTYQPPASEAGDLVPPPICQVLESWAIPCHAVAPNDPVAAIERDYLQHLLVHAGLSKVVWSGLRLALLHLSVPFAAEASLATETETEIEVDTAAVLTPEWTWQSVSYWSQSKTQLWSNACGFWHAL